MRAAWEEIVVSPGRISLTAVNDWFQFDLANLELQSPARDVEKNVRRIGQRDGQLALGICGRTQVLPFEQAGNGAGAVLRGIDQTDSVAKEGLKGGPE